MALGIYGLIGLTPMVPKRLFLPIPLFSLAVMLSAFPFTIYFYGRIQQVAWGISVCQVLLGLIILYYSQGSFKFRWQLVSEGQLGVRRFSWRNLSVFVLVNVFVLLPMMIVYFFLWTALAVDHFSEGFMALHPGGFTVQVRKYVRNDGKTIELFPMSHVADAGFYEKVSQTFPTNSIILMEGVTDKKNLLTNGISYKRMANALGLAEQHEKFAPTRGEMVRADVDVEQFSKNTIDFLNLIMLFHSQGVNARNVQKLMQYSPPPNFEEQLFDDLLRKRNQHLLEEIQSHLLQSDNIMVPWGVAHMPGIAKEIQKSGFRLDETREYVVIRFRGIGSQGKSTRP
jgi:DNA-binding transcriptional MerR regulator